MLDAHRLASITVWRGVFGGRTSAQCMLSRERFLRLLRVTSSSLCRSFSPPCPCAAVTRAHSPLRRLVCGRQMDVYTAVHELEHRFGRHL